MIASQRRVAASFAFGQRPEDRNRMSRIRRLHKQRREAFARANPGNPVAGWFAKVAAEAGIDRV